MSGKIKTSFFAVCLLGLFLALYFSWNQAKRENVLLCVSSVGDAIVEYSNIGEFAADDGNWYILSEKEVDYLLENFTVPDCPVGFAELPLDIREKNIEWLFAKQVALNTKSEFGRMVTTILPEPLTTLFFPTAKKH